MFCSYPKSRIGVFPFWIVHRALLRIEQYHVHAIDDLENSIELVGQTCLHGNLLLNVDCPTNSIELSQSSTFGYLRGPGRTPSASISCVASWVWQKHGRALVNKGFCGGLCAIYIKNEFELEVLCSPTQVRSSSQRFTQSSSSSQPGTHSSCASLPASTPAFDLTSSKPSASPPLLS